MLEDEGPALCSPRAFERRAEDSICLTKGITSESAAIM